MDTDTLFIEIEINTKNETEIHTSIASFMALYTYRYLDSPANIRLKFVRSVLNSNCGKIKLRTAMLRRELLEMEIICKEAAGIEAIHDLRLPIYSKDNNSYFIAGMCAVCRELVARQSCVERRKLLGFKASCLLAPAEASIWTRFCEVDVVRALSELLLKPAASIEEVPSCVVRFEHHMNAPPRLHNIYKFAREQANKTVCGKRVKRKERVLIQCTTPKEELPIEHRFAEGVDFTIADLILYPMMRMIFENMQHMLVHFPLLSTWLTEIDNFDVGCLKLLDALHIPCAIRKDCDNLLLKIPDCDATSLYKADPKRYKPRNRIYTTQAEVDAVLSKLAVLQFDFSTDFTRSYDGDDNINWDHIDPTHAQSSALPTERLARKRQQLENMANAVVSLAMPGSRVIDFCSGTGHLAILLALQLPDCTVIILENKAYSLAQAQKRTAELGLRNCRFYQCNIRYFEGNFDIGASLHACGTATDIVLQQCLRVTAHFVCCPCCYGSLQSMPHITYPLSKKFSDLVKSNEYMYIAHAADQAHEMGTVKPEITLQGQHCMRIVDTDRKTQAEEAGYEVILTRLKPEKCTPKNHLLVGRYINVS